MLPSGWNGLTKFLIRWLFEILTKGHSPDCGWSYRHPWPISSILTQLLSLPLSDCLSADWFPSELFNMYAVQFFLVKYKRLRSRFPACPRLPPPPQPALCMGFSFFFSPQSNKNPPPSLVFKLTSYIAVSFLILERNQSSLLTYHACLDCKVQHWKCYTNINTI